MKKILTIAVASIAVAAIADPFSPEIGVTTLSLTQKNNIIPVQFTSLADGGNVTADALVCTNNIPLTSHLFVYDANSGYTAWELSQNGWSGMDVSGGSASIEGITYSGGADEKTLLAGSAIWLSFPESRKPTSGSPVLVSVYGKVTNSYSVEIASGATKQSPKNYLLANPTDSAISLSTVLNGMTPKKGDTIRIIGDTDTYTYNETAKKWYKISPGESPAEATLPSLAAFTGFWYMSKGGSGTITLH